MDALRRTPRAVALWARETASPAFLLWRVSSSLQTCVGLSRAERRLRVLLPPRAVPKRADFFFFLFCLGTAL